MIAPRETFELQLYQKDDIPPCENDYVFNSKRKLTATFGWPDFRVLVIIEEGVHGKKNRPHYLDTMEKCNKAEEMGFLVFRYAPEFVMDGTAIEQIQRVFKRLYAAQPI